MFGTIVNCLSVLFGSIIGILFSKKLTKKYSEIIIVSAGVVTIILGLQMAFEANHIIYLALSLVIGGLLGTCLDIDGKILAFGGFLEKKFLPNSNKNNSSSRFAHAFLNSSVLFCAGAMSILGSFKAGVEKDYTILFTKSMLDGSLAIVFASTMGVGTAFSVISIFIYQGALTLFSSWLNPFISEAMIVELTGLGGALIVMIGFNMIEIKKIKIANYLPSLIFIIIFMLLNPYIIKITSVFV